MNRKNWGSEIDGEECNPFQVGKSKESLSEVRIGSLRKKSLDLTEINNVTFNRTSEKKKGLYYIPWSFVYKVPDVRDEQFLLIIS